ncbi:MAG: 2-phospho-L-lactate guanylyltransferase [Natronomonas sp.]
MDVLVPFAGRDPKTRLGNTLSSDERRAIAASMRRDVCEAIRDAGYEPTVLSTAPIDADVPVVVDERSLSVAVNDRLDPPMAVVMADLPLATPEALTRIFDADGDVVIAPGLGGGTNVLLVRHPEFRVDYHGASVRDHRRAATEIGATIETVDSFRLAVDVDETADFVEVLLHTDGRTAQWLEDVGFRLRVDGGRVGIERA